MQLSLNDAKGELEVVDPKLKRVVLRITPVGRNKFACLDSPDGIVSSGAGVANDAGAKGNETHCSRDQAIQKLVELGVDEAEAEAKIDSLKKHI